MMTDMRQRSQPPSDTESDTNEHEQLEKELAMFAMELIRVLGIRGMPQLKVEQAVGHMRLSNEPGLRGFRVLPQ